MRPGFWKFLILCLSLIIFSSASAQTINFDDGEPLRVQVLEADGKYALISVEVSSIGLMPVKNRDGERFYRILLNGSGLDPVIGEPELPVITQFVRLPAMGGAALSIKSVEYEIVDLNQVGTGSPIWPTQAPVDKLFGAAENAVFDFNHAAYRHAGFTGPSTRIGDVITMRAARFVPVKFAPVQYDAVANRLRVARRMIVEISFEYDAARVGVSSDIALQNPLFQGISGQLLINNETMMKSDKPSPMLDGSVPDVPVPGGYLIITAPQFVDNADLAALAQWKGQKGYDVTVASTDETGQTKEEIKAYIEDAYNNWGIPPVFLLFVGDTDTIPYWNILEVSDLYYATLQGDDYFPELFYSRFPARTDDDLANMVDKTLHYEWGNWSDPQDFLDATFMASDDNNDVSEGTHNYVIDNYLADAGFISSKRYYAQSATTEECIADINAGLDYLIYSGHGYDTGWADGPPISDEDVRNLTNTSFPFVASHACSTGVYNNDETFGETWVRVPAGGFAFWGASTSTQWDEDDILERSYFDGIFDDSLARNYYTLGEFTVYGMIKLYEHYSGGGLSQEYFEKYNIMGDASVPLWTGQPRPLTVDHTGILFFGTNSYALTVSSEGVSVEGALVGLSLDGYFHAAGLTGVGGLLLLEWDEALSLPGEYVLTATGQDYEPYQADLIATSAGSDGMLHVSPSVVGDGYEIMITVADADLAGDGAVEVEVFSSAEATPEVVALSEVGVDTGAFAGSILTSLDATGADDFIGIQVGDEVNVVYHDADTGSGPADKQEDIEVDLTPPVFAGLTEAAAGDSVVMLSWDAAMDPHGLIRYQVYRAEVSATQDFNDPIAETSNPEFVDDALLNYVRYFYVVRATDGLGNQEGNVVEIEAQPQGPQLFWEETWEDEAKWDHEWTIVNGGDAFTWTDENPGERSSAYMEGNFMIADSDYNMENMDEELISEVIWAHLYSNIELRLAQSYRTYSADIADIDISFDGGPWENLARYSGTGVDGDTVIDLSAYDFDTMQLRFHYYNANNDWWWMIDNIRLWGWPIMCENSPECDDGLYCNGAESCGSGFCLPGAPPCSDDRLWCNGVDSCDESADVCVSGTPPVCADDALYCNGEEFCNEDESACDHRNAPECPDDGFWCNGQETCDEEIDSCASVNAPNCGDDGLWCNGVESCDEDADACVRLDIPECPDDALWCNGDEACDEVSDACGHENAPVCSDDDLWCNGEEYCDEDSQECLRRNAPECLDDGLFCNGAEYCNDEIDACDQQFIPECEDDGIFCNGEVICDEELQLCSSSGDPCGADEVCDEENQACVPVASDDDADDDANDDAADDDVGGDDDDDDSNSMCGC